MQRYARHTLFPCSGCGGLRRTIDAVITRRQDIMTPFGRQLSPTLVSPYVVGGRSKPISVQLHLNYDFSHTRHLLVIRQQESPGVTEEPPTAVVRRQCFSRTTKVSTNLPLWWYLGPKSYVLPPSRQDHCI